MIIVNNYKVLPHSLPMLITRSRTPVWSYSWVGHLSFGGTEP
ncbi:hypothetical protein HanXRQr2_Chr17g0795451 [Helianthus annuus]|uniref:Uncharacterized protein n=1 Tax=Helianthus annuus TaxID=4232 RepID=A0A9K3GTF6_HELAN|nr:hypothetical protein HanXRQr2_Chr17g0795451 [Helianthus annuus]KAJ0812557.1 hypothetical protein HanPSC8_Chr17g0763321 [Helianthus annuus]